MPDGGLDEDFPHVVHTVDSLIALGRIRPVIVVGIPNTQRRRDLTGPTRVHADSTIAPRVGGSAAFRRFVREELVPAIEARYRTTRERAIIGESLAGLFVVETMLLEPALLRPLRRVRPEPVVERRRAARLGAPRGSRRSTRGHGRSSSACSSDGIGAASARLVGSLQAAPRGLAWRHVPRPDLTHATIFRAMKPAALIEALGAPARSGVREDGG